MAEKLSGKALEARLLMVDAALAMTKLRRRMRRAVRLVLGEGLSFAEAAEQIRSSSHKTILRQHIYRAVRVTKPKLAEVEDYVLRGSAKEKP